MRPPSLSGIVDVGIDLLTTVVNATTARIFAQTGDVVSQTKDSDGVEWWQHAGFASRPPKADPGKKAAQAVVLKTSDRDVCIASVDNRGLDLYGNLAEGETCVYAAGEDGESQARRILKKDGSAAIFTTSDNTADGQSVYFRVAKDGFRFVAPWGTLKFDATGFHILHSSGASFDLGGIFGVPGFDSAPLNSLTSYVRMQAGSVITASSTQALGTGPSKPLASAPEVVLALNALQTQIDALLVAVGAAGPGGPAAVTTAKLTMTPAAGIVSASANTIPSTTQSA